MVCIILCIIFLNYNKCSIMTSVENILQKIEEQVNSVDLKQKFSKQWEIVEIKDGVSFVAGLDDVMFSEVVVFENWTRWLVLDLLHDQVGVLILWDSNGLQQWQVVKWSWQIFSVGVGNWYLGRVVDGLWKAIDGKWEIKSTEKYPVERIAPGVMTRQSVNQPLQTGIKAIDSLIPIGRGQRELIIWDRQTGKTAIALDTIINQKGQDVKCIYVAVGQKESKVKRLTQLLKDSGAMEYTTVVSASISTPAVLQFLAPYVGCSLWEYYMNNGQDALIIYDDLSKHAVAYREISLLLRRPPGREAFPWDVFYLHSRLLERSARLNQKYGGWSMTALPIVETQAWDVSAYIPTNVISITDGQIFLESDLFNSGIKPAVNVWLSVSRVWWAAQTKIMKKVSGSLKLELASYRELAAFAQFSSDLDSETLKIIERGKRMTELLKQPDNDPLPFEKESVIIFLGSKGFLDELELSQVGVFEEKVFEKMETSHKELADKIRSEKKLSDEIIEWMMKLWEEVKAEFVK